MTPPPIIWYMPEIGLASATDPKGFHPGAVPYMLARPMPIATAPRDGTCILAIDSADQAGEYELCAFGWLGGPDYGWMHDRFMPEDRWFTPTHWLPLPPAPEEA